MAIALMLILLGVGVNIVMFSQAHKNLPRFAKTCQGCGCQAPPMEYPPAVDECPVCQWMAYQNLQHHLGIRHNRPEN